MPRCMIVYGTKEGHTARVVDRVASVLREAGVAVDTFDVDDLPENLSGAKYEAALVAGSIHQDEYKGAIKNFGELSA